MAQDASSSKRARTAEDEAEDYEGGDEGEGDEQEQDGSFVDSLMAQLGEHKAVLAPVATSAVAAAATYAAKKLPDLIDQLEGEGGDKLRGKLSDASDSGGVKGFAAGAASRAFDTGGDGNFIQRLMQGGEDEAKEEAKESGGVTGAMAKVSDKLGGGRSKGGFGWGRGRRLPIQVSLDVAASVDTVYGQYTQFEELNTFMHRVQNVEQEEPETLVWHENVWGRKRDWKVQITEQIPDERIAWELKGGGQGTGVISFHELAPRLTRIELLFDWQPKGLVEKIGSGLRVQNRAAKTDLRRFKAFVEIRGEESGTWPGKIEDGEAKGRTRNKRNTDADPVPTKARQHSEEDEKKASGEGDDKPARSRSGSRSGNGRGDDDSGRDAAREERKRHRSQRSQQRKQTA